MLADRIPNHVSWQLPRRGHRPILHRVGVEQASHTNRLDRPSARTRLDRPSARTQIRLWLTNVGPMVVGNDRCPT